MGILLFIKIGKFSSSVSRVRLCSMLVTRSYGGGLLILTSLCGVVGVCGLESRSNKKGIVEISLGLMFSMVFCCCMGGL